MNLIVLVIAVASGFLLYKMAGGVIAGFLPKKWWAKPIFTLIGLAVGLVYLYFAGYFIMEKDQSMPLAVVVALIPAAVWLVKAIASKSKLIEG